MIPLAPDPLFFLTATGGFPFLTGGSGLLDTQGEAQASLDLRPFGQHLRGLVLWAAALTLDRDAPGGVVTISRPVVLVLE